MQILYIVLGVLSLLATLMLSNLFGWGFREARAIGTLLINRELLMRVVTPEVLNNPSGEVALYGKPMAGGYALTMLAFRKAHDAAHTRARAMVRRVIVPVSTSVACTHPRASDGAPSVDLSNYLKRVA
jgi:hypothetical protein